MLFSKTKEIIFKQENENALADVKATNEELNAEINSKSAEINQLNEDIISLQESYEHLHDDYR